MELTKEQILALMQQRLEGLYRCNNDHFQSGYRAAIGDVLTLLAKK